MSQFLNVRALISALAAVVCCAVPAQASSLVFQPHNSAIFADANPGNSAALMSGVDRPKDPRQSAAASGLTPAAIVQQSVLGQISANINQQIFKGGHASGSFDLGGGNLISYTRAGGNVIINVTDPRTGTTVITLPDL
jgi:hypothetical protein